MVACTYVGYSCIHICNRTLMDTSVCINTSIHAECTIHRVRVSIDSSTVAFYTCRSAHIGYVYVCTNLYMPTTPLCMHNTAPTHLHRRRNSYTHTHTHLHTHSNTYIKNKKTPPPPPPPSSYVFSLLLRTFAASTTPPVWSRASAA